MAQKKWPCYFFKSNTTGEKDFEEFYTDQEDLDLQRYNSIGVIRNKANFDSKQLDAFIGGVETLRNQSNWIKEDIVRLFFDLLPNFGHKETGKYLDQRM